MRCKRTPKASGVADLIWVRSMREFIVLLFVSLCFVQSYAQESFGVVLLDVGDAHGKRLQFRTDSKTLAATPDWMPDSKEPPLSITAATKIAKEAGKHRLPKADDISIESIQLQRNYSYHSSPIPTKLMRWFYVFSIAPIIGSETYRGESATQIVILMDGKVIDPTPVK